MAVWFASKTGLYFEENNETILFNQKLVDYSAMTHWSTLSAQAAVVHTNILYDLLWSYGSFTPKYFLDAIEMALTDYTDKKNADHNYYNTDHLDKSNDDLRVVMDKLYKMWASGDIRKATVAELREAFGGGSCYVYDSLPFAYAWFLKDSDSVESICRVCEAGGDTDTNAKIVGEMIGALHGLTFFQKPKNEWTIKGLPSYDAVVAVADQLCDTLEIK